MDKESSENYSDFTVSTIGGIVGLGIVNGLVTFGLANLLDKFIIGPALCKSASVNICNDSLVYAYHVAAVFAGILAVVWLVRLFVYRPLLAVIALIIGTWPLYGSFFPHLSWSWAIVSLIILNILGYLAFIWILRSYNIVVAVILTIVTTILLFILSSL
jgi:hypothetical protein